MYKVVIYAIQYLLRNQVIRPITQEFHMILDLCLEYHRNKMDAFIQSRLQLHLFATCEISNYVIGISIQKANAATIAEAFPNRVEYQFGPPKSLIIDEDRTLLQMY